MTKESSEDIYNITDGDPDNHDTDFGVDPEEYTLKDNGSEEEDFSFQDTED